MHAATSALTLPADPAALRVMLLAVFEQRDTLAAEHYAAVAQNERLVPGGLPNETTVARCWSPATPTTCLCIGRRR